MITRENLERHLEAWARWVHRGQLIAGYGSLMGKMIEQKGIMNFGQGGHKSPVIDTIESQIEASLMGLYATHPRSVIVMRVHYGAVRLKGIHPLATRIDKAHALKISVKTYDGHLSRARKHILQQIG